MLATCFVQPLDLVKNRMQILKTADGSRPSSLSVLRGVVKNEGPRTLYKGLTAGLLRQATYTTTRLGRRRLRFRIAYIRHPSETPSHCFFAGIYTYLFDQMSARGPPSFLAKAGIGMVAGAFGAFVGTPAEISLIRMTSDGNLPVEQRRNYKNAFDAIFRISREEGVLTLWRGALPTMGRAMVVNAAQLASYSQAKQFIIQTGELPAG